jgi:hypothetical protein
MNSSDEENEEKDSIFESFDAKKNKLKRINTLNEFNTTKPLDDGKYLIDLGNPYEDDDGLNLT